MSPAIELAEPHAGVEPFGHDVGERRLDRQLDVDVGIVRQQSSHRRPEEGARGVLGGRDADRSRGLVTKLADRGELGGDLVQRGAERLQEPFAGLGRRNAPRRAHQQADAEPLLQPTDRVAERGLRRAELSRGARKTLLLGDDQEGVEIDQLLAAH